ncbi:MAG: AMP-binding protein, partial [Bacillota bacterium]
QFASFSFDVSVGEIFSTLLSGATLYLGKKELFLSGDKFTKWLKDQAITTAFFPPSVLKVTPYEELPNLTTIIAMGEACTSDIVKVWGKERTLINGYGPTEATIGSTAGVCTPDMEKPSIGTPNSNERIYIVDDNLNL